MERIQAAIQKAKEKRGGGLPGGPAVQGGTSPRRAAQEPVSQASGGIWDELKAFDPDPREMARNRIVTYDNSDRGHVTFDMIRTKTLHVMRQNGWTSLGITSPTAGCGKTTTAVNLAFSLAHQRDLRTLLVDLDLRHPAVASHIGLRENHSMGEVLLGSGSILDNFVRYGRNLAIGTSAAPVPNSAELLFSSVTAEAVVELREVFRPDIIIYDLPPALVSDDVMAFVTHLDCVLLVAAAEKTRLDEVDKSERDLAERTNVLGVVLNKCRYMGDEYGY
jgi:capsular exopolysaccharide synthesis family protein